MDVLICRSENGYFGNHNDVLGAKNFRLEGHYVKKQFLKGININIYIYLSIKFSRTTWAHAFACKTHAKFLRLKLSKVRICICDSSVFEHFEVTKILNSVNFADSARLSRIGTQPISFFFPFCQYSGACFVGFGYLEWGRESLRNYCKGINS